MVTSADDHGEAIDAAATKPLPLDQLDGFGIKVKLKTTGTTYDNVVMTKVSAMPT